LSVELGCELVAKGLSSEEIDRRVRNLRNRPLPKGGVFSIDGYVREQSDRWLAWKLQDAIPVSSTDSRAGNAPSIDWPARLVKRVGGWTPGAPSIAYAARMGLDILEEYSRFVLSGAPEKMGLTATWALDHARPNVERAFAEQLKQSAAEALERRASEAEAAE
jgi:hypothetical protein